jgi:hypothetical protein
VSLDLPPRRVLLHTEIMREHLLVTPHADGWSLSGLFDFEPAMRGAREYEFASVGLFVSRGDAAFYLASERLLLPPRSARRRATTATRLRFETLLRNPGQTT